MADAGSTSHETSLLNRYSDAVQIPIKGSQREQNQRFFGVPADLEGQEHTETWLYLALPEFVDLSYWCSSIEDQGTLNTCTAQAGIALVEYFARKTFNRHENLSARFLYKAARNLMHRTGDTGASVRETMRAMVLFGIPPEEYWPYTEHADKFDHEPNQFCYAYAQNYQAVKYCRLDHAGISKPALLAQIKAVLVSGVPCMFGFTVYNSIYEDFNFKRGHVPYPGANDEMAGGHAVVAVGYDDHRIIESADGTERSQGAILIRNSWGASWGQGGYGWLPYKYVLAGLTADWWALLKSEWFSKGHFGASIGDWDSHLGGKGGKKKDRRRRP
ncbi:C1 family peptidase [Leptolyngbya cf. ectocarpi LEGE 11479]|uniref:C1 family peptidase n=2 Tax=Leptolyngbya ectocarpi TaxID=1202 RepID=A0A929A000_LEPEC|nr:C1 family peptidase [Leptolyngbya cf. ectocarpi LEGE 11479]